MGKHFLEQKHMEFWAKFFWVAVCVCVCVIYKTLIYRNSVFSILTGPLGEE